MHLVASVYPSVRLFALSRLKPFDLRPSSFAWGSTSTLARVAMSVKVVGQRSKSNDKNHVFAWLLPCFKVKVGVKGQGQGQRSRSWSNLGVKVKFLVRSGR